MARYNRYYLLGVILMTLGLMLIGLHTSWWVALGVFFFVTGVNFEKNAAQLELNRIAAKLLTGGKKRVFWRSTTFAVWLMLVGAIFYVVWHIATMLFN